MKRWNNKIQNYDESPERIEQFLKEYEELCIKHQLCLSHEDEHGGFIIEDYDSHTISWVKDAQMNIKD